MDRVVAIDSPSGVTFSPSCRREAGVLTHPAPPPPPSPRKVGDKEPRRISFELYANACPKTSANFLHLCKGDKGKTPDGVPLHYKGSKFHRVIKNFMLQASERVWGRGRGRTREGHETETETQPMFSPRATCFANQKTEKKRLEKHTNILRSNVILCTRTFRGARPAPCVRVLSVERRMICMYAET